MSSGFTEFFLWEFGKAWAEDTLLQKELCQLLLGTLGGNQSWTIYFSWFWGFLEKAGSEYLNPDCDKDRTMVINSRKTTLSPQSLMTADSFPCNPSLLLSRLFAWLLFKGLDVEFHF